MLLQIIKRINCANKSLLFPLSSNATLRLKTTNIDYSRYPKLNEDEIEETFTRGSGPGGQAVNKTSNCVLLRHLPTNIIIKCHAHRVASRNRIEARRLLLEKLDSQLNGENSVAAQLKVLDDKKSAERKRRQQKNQELKMKWKTREDQAAQEQVTVEVEKKIKAK